jgi:hypothetical protein
LLVVVIPLFVGDLIDDDDTSGGLLLVVPMLVPALGIVKTVKRRSYSAFLDMMVVISLTVIRLTSSPSMATILSPGEIRSTRTLEVRTPDTTVPFESALLAKMIPSLPDGAITVILERLTTTEEALCAAEEDW